MNIDKDRFSQNILIMDTDAEPRLNEHRMLLILASVCLTEDLSAKEITQAAIDAIGSLESVVDAIFDFSFQSSLYKGLELLRQNPETFSKEWQEASKKKYAGITTMFDAMEIATDSPEANEVVDHINEVSHCKILFNLSSA